jgi:hypothetical protein
MGSHGWSCIEAGAVATATVGRVGAYEATTGPGRGRLVRSLAACCPWRSSSPSASVWRGACEVLRTWAVISRLATPKASYCMARKGSSVGGRFSDAQEQVTLLVDHLDQIEVWQAYMARSSALRADGWSVALDFCVDRKVPAGELAEVLERAMYAAWYDAVSMGDPTLRDIRADELEAKVAQFRDLDRQLVRDAAEHVVQACVARKPTTTVGPARIIDHQAQLKSRHMPVRRLLEQTAEVVTALKPCFMMSPLSVSQFLPAGFVFDTVIFDEASQITPADAANCIYRGRQLIVAGDDRQLPPTSFFQSGGSDTDSDEYEEGQFDEFESVLKLAKGTARLPSLPLRWHYRSNHESLITFSNYRFYEGNLITFPGAVESGADLGLSSSSSTASTSVAGRASTCPRPGRPPSASCFMRLATPTTLSA